MFYGLPVLHSHQSHSQFLKTVIAEVEGTMSGAGAGVEEKATKKHQVLQVLQKYLPEGAVTHNDLQQLVIDLAEDRYNRVFWQKRRLTRLADKVIRHPLVFLKGDTGAGKSWSARMVAYQLNPQETHFVVTNSPLSGERDWLGEYTLEEKTGAACPDKETCLIPGPVLQWAQTWGKGYQILILDEATLAQPGKLDWLNGLSSSPPFITWQGQRLPLTENHRVILTSNPEHYPGRWFHSAIRQQAAISYYPGLPDDFLIQNIAAPLLSQLTFPGGGLNGKPDAIRHAAGLTEALWKHYKPLLPKREFTPRDLQAIVERTGRYLHLAKVEDVSQAQFNSVSGRHSGISLRVNCHRSSSRNWLLWMTGSMPDGQVIDGYWTL